MNEMTETVQARTIETVTAEIVAIRVQAQRIILSAAVEIGRRLVEAKEMLPYGEWGPWLRERVEFSQKTAQRYMTLFDEYGDKQGCIFGAEVESSTLTNLSVSNALRLLAVPEEERETFAAEHDVEHLSARDMDALMKELEAEKRKTADAERELAAAGEKLSTMETELSERDERVKELESRPIETVVQEPDPAAVQKLVDAAVAEAKETFAKKEAKLKDKLAAEKKSAEDAQARAETAERDLAAAEKAAADTVSARAETLERELETLKKQLAMSDQAVTRFRTLFEAVQATFASLMTSLAAVEDSATRDKLTAATKKLLAMWGDEIAEYSKTPPDNPGE